MARINGNDLVLLIDDSSSGTKQQLAHAVSCTMSLSNALLDATNKDSSSWVEHISGRRSGTISFEGLVDYQSVTNHDHFETVMDYFLDGSTIYWSFGEGTDIFEGEGFISDLEHTGASDETASFSGTITISGDVTKNFS